MLKGCLVALGSLGKHVGGGFFFSKVELIYNIVLVLGVQQSDSVIHICVYVYIFFQFFSIW